MTYAATSQKLNAGDSVVELLDITHTANSWNLSRTPADLGDIVLDGDTYFGRDFKLARFEITLGNPLPRPTLTIDNLDREFYSYIVLNDFLKGATVRFREIYAKNLDGGSSADSSQTFTDLTYEIFQVKILHRERVEFECSTPPDSEQTMFGRPVYRNLCQRKYRVPTSTTGQFTQGNCPYTGSSYFTKGNNSTTDWRLDSCSGTYGACNLRFPNSNIPGWFSRSIGKKPGNV